MTVNNKLSLLKISYNIFSFFALFFPITTRISRQTFKNIHNKGYNRWVWVMFVISTDLRVFQEIYEPICFIYQDILTVFFFTGVPFWQMRFFRGSRCTYRRREPGHQLAQLNTQPLFTQKKNFSTRKKK